VAVRLLVILYILVLHVDCIFALLEKINTALHFSLLYTIILPMHTSLILHTFRTCRWGFASSLLLHSICLSEIHQVLPLPSPPPSSSNHSMIVPIPTFTNSHRLFMSTYCTLAVLSFSILFCLPITVHREAFCVPDIFIIFCIHVVFRQIIQANPDDNIIVLPDITEC
jgi:hypothetical protein